MSDTVRIRVYVSTGFANATHEEIYEEDRETWEAMTPEEQEKELDSIASDYASNYIEYGAYVLEDEDEDDGEMD
jgi:hypothetical protein